MRTIALAVAMLSACFIQEVSGSNLRNEADEKDEAKILPRQEEEDILPPWRTAKLKRSGPAYDGPGWEEHSTVGAPLQEKLRRIMMGHAQPEGVMATPPPPEKETHERSLAKFFFGLHEIVPPKPRTYKQPTNKAIYEKIVVAPLKNKLMEQRTTAVSTVERKEQAFADLMFGIHETPKLTLESCERVPWKKMAACKRAVAEGNRKPPAGKPTLDVVPPNMAKVVNPITAASDAYDATLRR